jgi:hypothetical protein
MKQNDEFMQIPLATEAGIFAGSSCPRYKPSRSYLWCNLAQWNWSINSRLIPYYAIHQASQPEMWGDMAPTQHSIQQLANAFTQEWTWAVGEMLRHWDESPIGRWSNMILEFMISHALQRRLSILRYQVMVGSTGCGVRCGLRVVRGLSWETEIWVLAISSLFHLSFLA